MLILLVIYTKLLTIEYIDRAARLMPFLGSEREIWHHGMSYASNVRYERNTVFHILWFLWQFLARIGGPFRVHAHQYR